MVFGRVIIHLDSKKVWEGPNLLTEIYRQRHASWLAGESMDLANYIAVGLGTTLPSPADEALTEEFSRLPVDWRWEVSPTITRYQVRWNVEEPPAKVSPPLKLKELGLFDKGPISILNYSLETWTAGNPDNWTLTGAGSSQIRSPVSYHKNYASQITAGTETTKLFQQISGYSAYAGKKVSFWAAVRHDIADKARLYIDDGVGTSHSGYHPGGNAYEVLRVSRSLDPNLTKLEIGLEIAANGGSPYFDWTNLVEDGNLWARALINVEKYDTQVLNIIWEIYTAVLEEGVMARNAFAAEELDVSTTTVTSLSSAVYAPAGEAAALAAYITVEDSNIRFWLHGEDPSSTSGHIAKQGEKISLETNPNISNFRAIALETAAKIKVTYLR